MGEILRLPDSDRDGRSSLGVTLYLIASSMIFGGLVLIFVVLRGHTEPWPPAEAPPLPRLLPALATLLVASVNVALRLGVRDLVAARLASLQARLSTSMLLAALYVVCGSALWIQMAGGAHPNPSPVEAIFYLLLSLFGIHVIGGAILLGWLRIGVKRGLYHARNSTPVRLVARLWYFLAATWLVIYVTAFLI